MDYFLRHEVVARIASDKFLRYGQWYGPISQYLPILLFGTLPVLATWAATRRHAAAEPHGTEQARFLWLWFGLPLLVLSLSQSRLPMYVLGLVMPATLLLAHRLQGVVLARNFGLAMAVWLIMLLALKAALPALTESRSGNSRTFAGRLGPMLPGKPDEIVFVEDMSRNGLNLYFDADIKKISFAEHPQPISDSTYDHGLDTELRRSGGKRIFIMKRAAEARFLKGIEGSGMKAVRLGEWTEPRKPTSRTRVIYTLDGEFPEP